MIHVRSLFQCITQNTQPSLLADVTELSVAIDRLSKPKGDGDKLELLTTALENYKKNKNKISAERYSAQVPKIIAMADYIFAHIDEIPY